MKCATNATQSATDFSLNKTCIKLRYSSARKINKTKSKNNFPHNIHPQEYLKKKLTKISTKFQQLKSCWTGTHLGFDCRLY